MFRMHVKALARGVPARVSGRAGRFRAAVAVIALAGGSMLA
jgi:hypothetical protein